MNHAHEPATKTRRGWRAHVPNLIAIVVLSLIALVYWRATGESRTIAAIERIGGKVRQSDSTRINAVQELLDAVVPGFHPRPTEHFDVIGVELDGTTADDAMLLELQRFRYLNDLSLAGTRVTDRGLESLQTNENLAVLVLNETRIGDEGLRHLATHKHLSQLQLNRTSVTDAGISTLRSITTLEYLTLDRDSKVSRQALRDLKSAIPGLVVILYDYDADGNATSGLRVD